MASQWYYRKGDNIQGPFNSSQLKYLATTGELQPTDSVRKDVGNWTSAHRIQGLFATSPPAETSPITPPDDSQAFTPDMFSPSPKMHVAEDGTRQTGKLSITHKSRQGLGIGCGVMAAGLIVLMIIGAIVGPRSPRTNDRNKNGVAHVKRVLQTPHLREWIIARDILEDVYNAATSDKKTRTVEVEVWISKDGMIDGYGNDLKEDIFLGTITRSDLDDVRKFKSLDYYRNPINQSVMQAELRSMPKSHLLKQ